MRLVWAIFAAVSQILHKRRAGAETHCQMFTISLCGCLFPDKTPMCGSPGRGMKYLCHLNCSVRFPLSPEPTCMQSGLAIFLFPISVDIKCLTPKPPAKSRFGVTQQELEKAELWNDYKITPAVSQLSSCLSRSTVSGSSFGSYTRCIRVLELLLQMATHLWASKDTHLFCCGSLGHKLVTGLPGVKSRYWQGCVLSWGSGKKQFLASSYYFWPSTFLDS